MNSLYRVIARTKVFKLNSSFSSFFDKKYFSSNYSSHNNNNYFSKTHTGRRTTSDKESSLNNYESHPEESKSNDDMDSSSQSHNTRRSQVTWLNRYNKLRRYNSREDLELFKHDKEIQFEEQPSNFSELSLAPQLMKNINLMGYDLMTDIQRNVIKLITEGKDVMGCSKTGSGKTIAFLLPIINNLLRKELTHTPNNSISFPVCLVLAPTRELAEQIYVEARKICYNTNIIVSKVYGGVPSNNQVFDLINGVDVLIATPGRLKDLAQQGYLDLSMVSTLIIDEADRMLDMGFIPQIKDIINNFRMPNERQNLFFSATFPNEIKDLARNFMNDFYLVTNSNDDKLVVNENIKHELVQITPEKNENMVLVDLINKLEGNILSKIYLNFCILRKKNGC